MTSPSIPGFEIAAKNIPTYEAGGDYFDFIKIDDDKFAVAIGDVSGKGVSAALLMAYLQSAVRSLVLENHTIRDLLKKVNRLISKDTDLDKYITFFIAIINAKTGKMEYINAGHNPPILLHKDTQIEQLKKGGPILGFLSELDFESGTLSIKSGEVLLMYTDGVTEAMNDTEEEFGEERLIQQLISSAEKPVKDIQTEILKKVLDFTSDKEQRDDITLLVLKKCE